MKIKIYIWKYDADMLQNMMTKCSNIWNLGMLMPKETLLYGRWYSLFLAHKI